MVSPLLTTEFTKRDSEFIISYQCIDVINLLLTTTNQQNISAYHDVLGRNELALFLQFNPLRDEIFDFFIGEELLKKHDPQNLLFSFLSTFGLLQ